MRIFWELHFQQLLRQLRKKIILTAVGLLGISRWCAMKRNLILIVWREMVRNGNWYGLLACRSVRNQKMCRINWIWKCGNLRQVKIEKFLVLFCENTGRQNKCMQSPSCVEVLNKWTSIQQAFYHKLNFNEGSLVVEKHFLERISTKCQLVC